MESPVTLPEAFSRGFLSMGRSLAASAFRFPDYIALSDTERNVTYRQLNADVNRLARALKDLGVKAGDHVAVLFGNTVEHVVILYALAKLGAVSVVLDIKWTAREASRALSFFDCDLLLFDAAFESNLVSNGLQALRLGSFARGGGSKGKRLEDLIAKQPAREPDSTVGDEDIFMIMLTSGTIGLPKGCIINHKTYAIHCLNAAIVRGFDETSCELAVVPIYYNSGRGTLLAHLFFGGRVYLRTKFDPRETMELVQSEKITSLALAPTMCNRLLQLPDLASFRTDSIKSLRKAGSPLSKKMVEELSAKITPNIYQSYATTDTGQVTLLRPHEQLVKLGSSGRPIWGVEVEVVDESRDPLPNGQEGEIRVRSPHLCQGYYKNPEEQKLRFSDGWYYTGDIGRFDADGYLYVIGRKKDIIKTGSINVAPKEIEEILLLHPEVADVAVVGVPDAEWGEAVKAYVVAKEGHGTSEQQILDHCRAYLASYKIPKKIEFLSHLERNALGKITVDSLRQVGQQTGEQ